MLEQTVEDDEIMVSFDVTFLYTNIPINDTLFIMKDLFVNDNCLGENENSSIGTFRTDLNFFDRNFFSVQWRIL